MLKSFLRSIVPADNPRLYRWCRRYVDRYRGENNGTMEANGELHFIKRSLPQCHTVFDIGANVGQWSALALSVNPKISLHCFEPCRSTYQRLLSNAFPPNVFCNNVGMSSVPSEAKLFLFDDEAGTNSLYNSLYKRQGTDSFGLSAPEQYELIILDTVDHYCESRGIQAIDLMKVDVEGHELEAFKGASNMFGLGRINMVQFEYSNCNIDAKVLLKDLFAFFAEFEYCFYKMYPNELRHVARYDQALENFQYQNWVLIQNGYSLLPR